LIRGMKEAYEQAGLYAFVGIIFLVLLAFRAVRPALLALIPLAVGSLWTLGFMGLLQVKFNVANLIVLPLIMAPAVEGGIMIIYRYREESRKARRPSPLPQSTGRAVVFSSLSTIVGFGSLMISRHWGIFSVGLLLTVGVASVLLASVTVLPSLLAILSARGRGKTDEPDADDEPSAAANPASMLTSGCRGRRAPMDVPKPEKPSAAIPLEPGWDVERRIGNVKEGNHVASGGDALRARSNWESIRNRSLRENETMSQGLKTSVRWIQQLAIPVAVLLLLSFARPVLAAEPQERMRETPNAVAAILKDPSLRSPNKPAERQQRVRQIILDTFDFEEMAKLALGPSWERLTPQQRTEFVSLFGNLF
jgi:MlaC protein/MMPL family